MVRLTRYGTRSVEDVSDSWVHRNEVVALMGNLVVANAHLLVHPSLEWLTNNGVDDVGEVATTQLGDLLARRQSHLDLQVILGELKDALDGEALELGHINELDVVAGDDCLDPHC